MGTGLGFGFAFYQFLARPPAIHAYAINSGTLWGAWLLMPLAKIQLGNPALSAAGSLAGAISFGLWAHHGGLSEGQLAMINSVGFWAGLGASFWGTTLLQQAGRRGFNNLNLTISTGASLVAGALTAWAARHVRLSRAQVLWMDLAGGVGILFASLLAVTTRVSRGASSCRRPLEPCSPLR